MKTAQSRRKIYVDKQRRDLEFRVGDHAFVKVVVMKGFMRFCKKGKLSSRFIGPFEVLKKIGALAYRVTLPPMLAGLIANILFEERPMQILDRQERRLWNKVIHMVIVKWLNHSEEEAT
ncbi:uncharacterized protein [Primulina huaijiensis]|uniref:uncharacterized protein n=1 Tax=Primulina huaijiensis TaxID=1492673 RepID=UPI003CC6F2D3